MRAASKWAKASGAAAVLALGGVGCGSTSVTCEDLLNCGPPDAMADSSVADVSVGMDADDGSEAGEASEDGATDALTEASDSDVTTDSALDGGVEAEAAPSCDLEHTIEGDAGSADSGCLTGVFVSPAVDDAGATGVGTRSAPLHSVMQALTLAAGRPVFVCDDGRGYAESLLIGTALDGASVDGGYTCGTWARSGLARTRLHPSAGAVLTVQGLVKGFTLDSFELSAPDAVTPGSSSIAAIVNASANVTLIGVRVVAGKGAPGAPGANGSTGLSGDPVDSLQHGGRAACSGSLTSQNGGAWSGSSGCGSRGGQGGTATQGNDGSAGFPGVPRDMHVTPLNVNNRGGEGMVGADGAAGSNGDPGTNGAASAPTGTFTVSGYMAAPPGSSGSSGWVAQGGGGGGASNASGSCIGASGGAGGMGGCGGGPGLGGGSGGASVALLSFASSLRLDRCELVSAGGGAGGKGGNGGLGGMGAIGAAGGDAYAGDAGPAIGKGGSGGKGGNGGPGGSGAGGSGGPSYALVFKGELPLRLNGTTLIAGLGGAAGLGGLVVGAVKAEDGAVGAAAEQLALTAP
jgi:hypothetical protein